VFREIDTAARVGGDEFFVLASNIGNKEIASGMAKKILDQIIKHPTKF